MLADVPTTLILLIVGLIGMLLSYRVTVFGIAVLSPIVALATWALFHGVATALVAVVIFQVGFSCPRSRDCRAGGSVRIRRKTGAPKSRVALLRPSTAGSFAGSEISHPARFGARKKCDRNPGERLASDTCPGGDILVEGEFGTLERACPCSSRSFRFSEFEHEKLGSKLFILSFEADHPIVEILPILAGQLGAPLKGLLQHDAASLNDFADRLSRQPP